MTTHPTFDANALGYGEWVPDRRGIQRWVPTPAEQRPPQTLEEAVERMNADGKNDREIGDELGISPRGICHVRRRLGIPAIPQQVAPKEARPKVDEVAVRRLIQGDRPVPTTIEEREQAVRELTELGLIGRQIADVTGMTTRTVWRIRKRLGIRELDTREDVA